MYFKAAIINKHPSATTPDLPTGEVDNTDDLITMHTDCCPIFATFSEYCID